MPPKEKLILIDSHALIHRAFHALPPFRTKKGELVNAVYGYATTLIKVLTQFKPDYVVACFDFPSATFRHEKFAEYKATRKKAPDELYSQIPIVKDLVRAFNIPLLEKEGYEADDIIATVAKMASKENIQTIIVTGDLDTLQLVDKNTKVFTLRRGIQDTVLYDESEVYKKLGVTPAQVADYKALRGDASDNIPGVPGVGEKTASELISRHKTLENLYKDFEKDQKISEKLKKLLKENKEKAFLSKELATTKNDVDIVFDKEKAKVHDFSEEKVFNLFRELEFRSLIARIPELQKIKQKDIFGELEKEKKIEINENFVNNVDKKLDYQIVDSVENLEKVTNQLKKQKVFAIDTETTSLFPVEAKLVGVSISFNEKNAFYFPLNHKSGKNLDFAKFANLFEPIFLDQNILKCGHNIKYDLQVLENNGLKLNGPFFDSMVASYLLYPNLRSHSLDDLAFAEYGIKTTKLSDLMEKNFGKQKKFKQNDQVPVDAIPIKELGDYAAEDADLAFRFRSRLVEQLKEKNLTELFEKTEMPLVPILANMETNGVLIDDSILKNLSKEFGEKITKLTKSIYSQANAEFNISSPKQLSEVLFNTLNLSDQKVKKTKTGISTAAGELENLKNDHEIIKEILEYRELTKLKNTYVDALPALISGKTKRIHTNYNQTITATGRLSSSNPNLQNIPIRSAYGEQIRKAFVAPKGFALVGADYSQVELRVLAHISKDETMVKAFKENKDIHSITASEIFEKKETDITKQERRTAKIINFGIIYGMSANRLSNELNIPYKKADEFIKKYFSLRKGVVDYTENIAKEAREKNEVKTLFGRIRQIPEINSSNFFTRSSAERAAINTPIQGTAADLMKIAMIKIYEKLGSISKEAKMIMQVHDELVFEVPENEIEKIAKFVKSEMEEAFKFDIPIIAEVSVGKNWGEMEKIK